MTNPEGPIGFKCGACNGRLTYTRNEPDHKEWTCPCGQASGFFIHGGTVDLSSLELEPESGNTLIIPDPCSLPLTS